MSRGDAERERNPLAPYGDLVRTSVVDGVRVVHAEAPGPMSAALLFRVGSRDEPLPLRGITHLIEHLALHDFDGVAQHTNGHVQGDLTQFVVSGTERHVVALLNGVCAALRELPLQRIEAEKGILVTEQQSRPAAGADAQLQARCGARSLARVTFSEFALDWVGPDEVEQWARQWFVAENAVLWLSSDTIPDGLDLRLPSGQSTPRPRVEQVDRPRPSATLGPPRSVAVDALLPRSTAASIAVEVMRAAVFRELRREGGLSYTAHATYESVDDDTARLTVFADATDANQGAVVGAMVDAISALRAGRIDERDLESAMTTVREGIENWRKPGLLAPLAARRLLFTDRVMSIDELEAEVDAVTPEHLTEVILAFWDDAVWMTPEGPLDWVGATPVDYSSAVVDGRWFDNIGSRESLVLGPAGVSWVDPDRTLTVLYSEVELYGVVPDGAFMLVGRDSVTLTMEPTLLRDFGPEQLAEIRDRVAPERRVQFAPRPPEGIPSPPTIEVPRARRNGRLIAGLVALIVAAPVSLVAAAAVPIAGALGAGLAIGGIVLVLRRLDSHRLGGMLNAGIVARGDTLGDNQQTWAFAIAPTLTLVDGIRELQKLQGQPLLETPPSKRAKLLVFVDRHVLFIDDAERGRLLTVPSALITSITSELANVRSMSSSAKTMPSVRVRFQRAGNDYDLVLSPSGDFSHKIAPAEGERIAAELRVYFDKEYVSPPS